MKRSLPNLRYYPGIYLETEENQENRSQDGRSPELIFEPGTSRIRSGGNDTDGVIIALR